METENREATLTPQESMLISHIRELDCGSVTIFIQNGVPVRIEQITESIQLK